MRESIMITLKQAIALVRFKTLPIQWKFKVFHLLSMIAFEVCVPAAILYLYIANMLSKNDFSQEKLDAVNEVSAMHMG